MPLKLTPCSSLEDVTDERAAWHQCLSALPELFVEMAVRQSAVWAVVEDARRIGYVTALERTLTQMYIDEEHRTDFDRILDQVVAHLELELLWASTFDPFVVACLSRTRAYSVVGYHFRRQLPGAPPTPRTRPDERVATPADAPAIAAINHPEVFEDPAEIPVWVDRGQVTLFEVEGDLVGFGLCTPTGPLTRAADVGVLVRAERQHQGFGAWIVHRMTEQCRADHWVPTCGCGVDNAASRRTLERAGFVADHRLLEFDA